MRKFFICVFVFLLVVPVISTADTKVGLSPAVVMFSIDDPDGDTEDYVGFQPFGITTVHDLNNKYRVMAVFNYFDFEVDPSTSEIGQSVEGYHVGTIIQRIIRIARGFNFHAGLGVSYTAADFTGRHTVAADGYLQDSYDDRSESLFSLLGNISKEWEVSKSFEIGADLSYQYGLKDGLSGLKGVVSVFYKF